MTRPAPHIPPAIHARAESLCRQMIIAQIKAQGFRIALVPPGAINLALNRMLRRSEGWAIIASLMESSP